MEVLSNGPLKKRMSRREVCGWYEGVVVTRRREDDAAADSEKAQ